MSRATRALSSDRTNIPDFDRHYQRLVQNCARCNASVATTGTTAPKTGKYIPPPYAPLLKVLHMDFCHFVTATDGSKGFFCTVDVCSRTLRFTPSKEVTSSSAASALGEWIRVGPCL